MAYQKTSIDSDQAFLAGDHTMIQELLHPGKTMDDLPYSIAHGTLEPGTSSLPHVLEGSKELYIFLRGEGILHIDGEEIPIKTGDLVLVPASGKQHLVNSGDQTIEFFCVVSPPWSQEKEVIC